MDRGSKESQPGWNGLYLGQELGSYLYLRRLSSVECGLKNFVLLYRFGLFRAQSNNELELILYSTLNAGFD